jgi:tetrahydromethanopterin S-methyltransferase subunit G
MRSKTPEPDEERSVHERLSLIERHLSLLDVHYAQLVALFEGQPVGKHASPPSR